MAEIVQLWLMFCAGFVTGWFLRDAKASRYESQLYRKLTAKIDAALAKRRTESDQ